MLALTRKSVVANEIDEDGHGYNPDL